MVTETSWSKLWPNRTNLWLTIFIKFPPRRRESRKRGVGSSKFFLWGSTLVIIWNRSREVFPRKVCEKILGHKWVIVKIHNKSPLATVLLHKKGRKTSKWLNLLPSKDFLEIDSAKAIKISKWHKNWNHKFNPKWLKENWIQIIQLEDRHIMMKFKWRISSQDKKLRYKWKLKF